MIGCFCHIHIHFAGSGAFPAGNTFALVHLHLKKGHPVHQGIKCSQRAKPFTKRAIKQYTQYKDSHQNGEFPCKKRAKCRPDAGIGNRQRDRPLQHTLRTEVFAEKRISHAYIVYNQCRQQDHHYQQNHIFQIGQGLQLFCGELFCWNFMQQLLKPTEGAQKPANKASQQYSQ